MAQMEIYEPICDTEGCGSRPTRNIVSDGVVISRNCTKHSSAALAAANKAEREKRETSKLKTVSA